MKKIKRVSITSTHVEEFFGFLKLVKVEVVNLPKEGQEPAAAGALPALTTAVTKFENAFDAFDAALKSPRKLASVTVAAEADDDRDSSWRNGYAYTKVMCNHPEKAVRTIAEKIKDIYDKYGDPTALAQMEESGILHNLLQDLKAVDSGELETVGFQVWIDDLDEKENTFLEAVSDRTEEESGRIVGIVKQTRSKAEDAYRELVELVNILVKINGESPYATFIDHVNVLIDRQKNVLRRRKGEGPASDRPVIPDEDEEPENPETPDKGDEGEGGESDRPVIPDEGEEEPEKDENGDDLPEIE